MQSCWRNFFGWGAGVAYMQLTAFSPLLIRTEMENIHVSKRISQDLTEFITPCYFHYHQKPQIMHGRQVMDITFSKAFIYCLTSHLDGSREDTVLVILIGTPTIYVHNLQYLQCRQYTHGPVLCKTIFSIINIQVYLTKV